ncbi:MAG: IS200/IS605 family transposase [Bacteroidia bacterium]|nr:IS200/IS605 family transposase [Bacteroidia bacterium]
MSHICFIYHIVWRTYRSEMTIVEENERELYAYILGICKNKNCQLYRINSMPDHVHLCVSIHPSISVSEFMKVLKGETSKWMKDNKDMFPNFVGWGEGYAAFTYSDKDKPNIINYIKNQKIHHKRETFPQEYRHWLLTEGQDPESDTLLRDK